MNSSETLQFLTVKDWGKMQVAKHALIDKSLVTLCIHLKPLQALI